MCVTPAEWPSSPSSPKSHGQMPTASLFTTTVIRLAAAAASSSHGPSIASSPSIGRSYFSAPSCQFAMYERRRKVRRLTQLITRHVHHILLLFNVVLCTEMHLVRRFSKAGSRRIVDLALSASYLPCRKRSPQNCPCAWGSWTSI